MSARDGNLTGLAFQRETILGGVSSEPVFQIPGFVSISYDPVLAAPDARVGLARMKEKETTPALYWRGAIDLEHGNNATLSLFLDLFFSLVSILTDSPSPGLTTNVYRPARLKPIASGKLFIDVIGGPYKTLHGVVIDRITFSVRLKQIVRTQIYFKALDIEGRGGVQESNSITDTIPVASRQASVSLGGISQRGIVEFTVNFAQDKTPCRFGQNKKPRRFSQTGHFDCSGDFQQYLDDGNSIESLVTSRGETSLGLTLNAGSGRQCSIALPRIVFTNRTQPIGKNDIFMRAPWTALADPDINESSEPLITAVTPTLDIGGFGSSIQHFTNYLLTEDGNKLITEDGNRLIIEP